MTIFIANSDEKEKRITTTPDLFSQSLEDCIYVHLEYCIMIAVLSKVEILWYIHLLP